MNDGHFPRAIVTTVLLLIAGAGYGRASAAILNETFHDDPVGAGRAIVVGDPARLTHSPSESALAAAYDSALSTTKLLWSLGTTFTAQTSFRYDVRFSLSNVTTEPLSFAQISFGLVNATTTGDNRAGGPTADGSSGNAYDTVTVDYFPNVSSIGSNTFGPVLGPTVIETDDGVSGFFPAFDDEATEVDESRPGSFIFPFGNEVDMNVEGALPLDTFMDLIVTYDADERLLTLQMPEQDINSNGGGGLAGGADGDKTTIQSVLPGDAEFSVDSFAILLWQDTFGAGLSTVVADVTVDRIVVVPEPKSAAALVVLAMVVSGIRWAGWSRGDRTVPRTWR